MNKYKYLIYFATSLFATFVYMSVVEPQVDKPVGIAGFFGFVLALLFFLSLSLLAYMRVITHRYLTALLLSLAGTYVIALSSLRSLSAGSVLVVMVVVALLITFIIKPKRR